MKRTDEKLRKSLVKKLDVRNPAARAAIDACRNLHAPTDECPDGTCMCIPCLQRAVEIMEGR